MRTLKFSHKIMLAASLVVIAAFASFSLFNDYLQRTSIRNSLANYLHDVGLVSTGNIQHWLDGRMQLLDNLAESVQDDSSAEPLARKSSTSARSSSISKRCRRRAASLRR